METTKAQRKRVNCDSSSSFSGAGRMRLELLRVKEVIRVREITWLPKAPSFVKGIINLRGDVIPIIDLRDKFVRLPRQHPPRRV